MQTKQTLAYVFHLCYNQSDLHISLFILCKVMIQNFTRDEILTELFVVTLSVVPDNNDNDSDMCNIENLYIL